ncbi:MAG: hypothetical protein M3T56_14920, partial [Chloroflexota bacterium]|nr:hypothetical protein [Chloroflexota bacterium]
MPEDFEVVPLTAETADLINAFECSIAPPYTTELVEYLKTKALPETQQSVSTTWLWVDAKKRLGAYATLSATSVPSRAGLGATLGSSKPFIPAVMIDQLAVADYVLNEPDVHLGYAVFLWARREVVLLNRRVGCRLIRLDVQIGNWGAYRAYRKPETWNLKALPAMTLRGKVVEQRNGTLEPVPDAAREGPPEHLDPET